MVNQLNIVQYTLMGASGRLVQQKGFNDILVSEFTKVAGIFWPTFYRHYYNILDILDVEMQTLLTNFSAQIRDNYHYILQTVTFFQEHQTTVKIILSTNHEELIRQNIAKTLAQYGQATKH